MDTENGEMDRRTFLGTVGGVVAGVVAYGMGETNVADAMMLGGAAHGLARVSPESVGIDSSALLAFLDAIEKRPGGIHSLMVLRHGKVAAEGWWAPYTAHNPHMLYSLSKSFTSTAVGLAISEGLFTVEDLVTSFFPGQLPATIDPNLAQMRVKHLLTMNTGHDKDATGPTREAKDGDWVRQFLSLPVEHEPGTKFVYNSAATYMLSAIVQTKSGKTVLEYLTPRLFNPLGIVGPTWETCPKGIDTGGWGLAVKTEDIARFGQLYLQKGVWEGKQIVPASWVADATSKQVSNGDPNSPSDWNQGYGYQFWRCRHNAFRGDGAFGQYCVVLPELDAVLAITSGLGDMQAVLNAVWDHLLPAFQPNPLPASNTAQDLKHRLSSLAIPTPHGESTSPQWTQGPKTFAVESNPLKIETISFTGDGDKLQYISHFASDTKRDNKPYPSQSIQFGLNSWVTGTAVIEGIPSHKIAAHGSWTAPDTFTGTICFNETPFIQTAQAKFTDDSLILTLQQNVAFGPTGPLVLKGKLATGK